MKFLVSIRFHGEAEYIGTNNYMMAWTLYHFFAEKYPATACIDILDGETGEVFQSNQLDD